MTPSSQNDDTLRAEGAGSDGGAPDAPSAPDELSEPVRITGWASGGEGVGRLADGRVVFVEGAVPGDLALLADVAMRKKVAWARLGRLVEASDARTEPACAHFGRCGGCVWQHVRYPVQLEAKRDFIRNALSRIAGIDYASEIKIEGSPSAYGYRIRARVVESEGGVGYRMRGSHRTLPISECPILVPSVQRALSTLIDAEQSRAAVVQEASPSPSPSRRRRRAQEWILTAGSTGDALVEPKLVKRARGKAAGSVSLEVLGEKLRVSSESFVQGNALLWDAFAAAVRTEVLCDPEPERFVELYAGIGFLTLPLARAGLSGVAIEGVSSATSDLAWNLEQNGLRDRVEVKTARVEKRGDLGAQFARADVLLVDPPRTGLEKEVREAIQAAGPRRLVYVSCDPGTWARDLGLLTNGAYRLASVKAFDLFPQTPHVEIVSRLERV